MNTKKVIISTAILIASIVIGFFVYWQATTVTGDELAAALKKQEYSTVKIEVIKQDSNSSEPLVSRELTADELSSFYDRLGAATLRTFDLGGKAINSPYRISLYFLDSTGGQVTVVRFTYNEYMDFHIHNETTQISENCRITESTLGEFWDAFICEAQQ